MRLSFLWPSSWVVYHRSHGASERCQSLTPSAYNKVVLVGIYLTILSLKVMIVLAIAAISLLLWNPQSTKLARIRTFKQIKLTKLFSLLLFPVSDSTFHVTKFFDIVFKFFCFTLRYFGKIIKLLNLNLQFPTSCSSQRLVVYKFIRIENQWANFLFYSIKLWKWHLPDRIKLDERMRFHILIKFLDSWRISWIVISIFK